MPKSARVTFSNITLCRLDSVGQSLEKEAMQHSLQNTHDVKIEEQTKLIFPPCHPPPPAAACRELAAANSSCKFPAKSVRAAAPQFAAPFSHNAKMPCRSRRIACLLISVVFQLEINFVFLRELFFSRNELCAQFNFMF